MRHRLAVAAESGLIVFRDATVECPFRSDHQDDQRRALRSREEEGLWFVLDAEDPISYRIDLCVGEEPSGLPEHRFQRVGGAFLLRVQSGRLVASSSEEWSDPPEAELEVPPGTYALSVLGPGDFDGKRYDAEYRSVVGDRDYRFRTIIDKLGLCGCLASIIAALTLLIPATREYWMTALVILAIGWLPFLTLQRLPRYRRIEKLISEHEASLPHYVIRLLAVEHPEGLTGGHITTG